MARRNRGKNGNEVTGKQKIEEVVEQMAKNDPVNPLSVTTEAIFVCREKGSYLLFNAYKLKIEKGVVTSVEQLTRAGDMFKLAVSVAANRLWDGRTRTTEEVFK